ncbi:hypothetical protein ZIOFF_029004 [Zingiber officinale]|uniref:Leucine-rich repeat-containing N-terminal plant-type domain-containing protein n=2 Tax=Zingiber officinale TaxID=94328 RepID=A0A8J5LE64_ZINOF|nr:hypothetical protein ZIOFF_029004 [Zingiber officinale]
MVSPSFSKLFIFLLITRAICCCLGQGGGDGGATVRCIQSERRALLAIISNTSSNGLSGEGFSSWTGDDCCRWKGVTCDNATDRITELDLSFSHLVGQIPESLGNDLAHLVSLNLSYNDISGRIPESLGKLVRLQEVRLYDNHISGQIPEAIGNLQNLRVLHLELNSITGQIPRTMGDLCNLTELDLSSNNITGRIPESLGKLVKLQEVRLFDNLISGQIPETIGNLPNLRVMHLEGNSITGQIPRTMGDLCNLTELDLSSNNITGRIPESLWKLGKLQENLPNLRVLHLEGNSITGQIPRTMGDMCNLTELDLSHNKIYGELTDLLDGLSSCAQGASLSSLNVEGNNLSGRIPTSLSKLSQIQNLYLSSNSFRGDVTGAHFSNLTNLYHLDISNNSLNVMLPTDWIPPFNNVLYISMSYCRLPAFPNWIRNQTSLQFLYLSSVGMSGNLPVWFGTIFMKQNLRVALFRSIDRSSDWIYVQLALKYGRLKSKWQRT